MEAWSARRAVSAGLLALSLFGLFVGALEAGATASDVALASKAGAGSAGVAQAVTAFEDVPSSHWAYSYITALAEDGFVAGCATDPPRYCPEAMTNRAEMAVFVERGDHGGGFVPGEPARQVFADVLLNAWYAKWVTALWEDGYTAGCQATPLSYCPEAGHTRAEAAVFFVRLRLGKTYEPPPATTTVYEDVPVGADQPWYSRWIAAAAEEGIVQACEDNANRSDQRFRPTEGLTRAEGTCMLFQAKLAAEPTPPPPDGSSEGILISPNEIRSIPISGEAGCEQGTSCSNAWNKMRTAAYGSWGTADLKNQDNKFGINVLAGAFVYVRTGDGALRAKVRDGIITAKRTMDDSSEWQTENGALSLGRQLGAFVISADLIDLKNYDAAADTEFRNFLRTIRSTNVGTHGRWKSIAYTCENSANNWGTFACPSRLAASIYLADTADVQRVANILRAWMGERSYYPADAPGQNGYFQPTAGWDRTATWACNAATWTAINPACTKSGVNLDGVIVEDASRGGVCCNIIGDGYMYSWEVLQGAFVSAELLYRTGAYGNPYAWSNNALKRAMDFLQRNGWGITNPASYVPWMANTRYNTNYPTTASQPGRIMGWGDWLYQK